MKIHKAKKSLGQNFLKSEPALKKIIEAGEIKPDDVVLEIGPGRGALTKKLLEYAGKVVAVEKDHDLLETLQEKFREQIKLGTFVLVHGDILEFDVNDLKLHGYKIIANIPYNITGAILKKFLTAEHQPERMVLMVQHEVAQRIVARDGKESILSISVKAYGEPKMVMKVPARYFSPAPKVDSTVIVINNISRKNFIPPLSSPSQGRVSETVQHQMLHSQAFEEKFWEIVKTGFAHKRKKLSGNLRGIIDIEKLKALGLNGKRAENLSLTDWISLTKL